MIGGPETDTSYCSELTDVCEYGEHQKCDGVVNHRPVLLTQDGGYRHDADHSCSCMCHHIPVGEKFLQNGRTYEGRAHY